VSPSNADKIRRYYEAWNAGGLDGARVHWPQLFDSEVEFSPFLGREIEGKVYRGQPGFEEFFGELHDMLGDVRYEPLETDSVGDDLVVIRTNLVGTGRGSSVPLSQELGIVCEFEDGLVRRMAAFGSHAQAREVAQEMARA
jgi:ketosteroid isomerase-like protein